MATPVILDVDTGIDDAIAIMLAAKSKRMEIKAITTVFGNSTVDITTLNTLRVLELLGLKDIPVAAGAKKGILSPLKAAQRGRGLPGDDGMMGLADKLPFPKKSPEQINACQLMEKVVSESQNKVIFICMGPLTNIASFLNFLCMLPNSVTTSGKVVHCFFSMFSLWSFALFLLPVFYFLLLLPILSNKNKH